MLNYTSTTIDEVKNCDDVIETDIKDPRKISKAQAETFFVISMELADRNLKNIFDAERPSMSTIQSMSEAVGKALAYLHSLQLMHGDLKMLNIVRIAEKFKLIDLDAIASLDTPGKE